MNELLQAKLSASSTVRNRHRPFTVYEITVTSTIPTIRPWFVHRRYSEFDALHAGIVKTLSSSADPNEKMVIRKLPQLSPKRIRSLASDVVKQRMIELQAYLLGLMEIEELRGNVLMFDFLDVPHDVRTLLRRPHIVESPRPSIFASKSSESPEVVQIEELLKQLNYQDNRVRSLKEFEIWYFDNRPRIREAYIEKLLIGDATYQGLLHACGTVAYSKVAWRAALNLVVALLDIERNKEARMFQEKFMNLDRIHFTQMNLHRCITDPTTQENGFKITHLIRNRRPDIAFEDYVQSDEARRVYDEWAATHVSTSHTTMAAKLNIGGYYRGQGGRGDDEEKNEKGFDWSDMTVQQIGGLILSGLDSLSRDTDGYRTCEGSQSGQPVTVKYKKNSYNNTWIIKARYVSNYPAERVFHVLKRGGVEMANGDLKLWNAKLVSSEVMERVDDDDIEVVHDVYKNFNALYKYRDAVTVRACRQYEVIGSNGSRQTCFAVGMASIDNYNRIVPAGDGKRMTILPCGFVIGPTTNDPDKSHVSMTLNLTGESVLMVSADLLGETDELVRSVQNIDDLVAESIGF